MGENKKLEKAGASSGKRGVNPRQSISISEAQTDLQRLQRNFGANRLDKTSTFHNISQWPKEE